MNQPMKLEVRWLAIACMLPAVLALGGCGRDDGERSSGAASTQQQTAGAAQNEAASSKARPARPDDPQQAARDRVLAAIDESLAELAKIDDYSYMLRKQERVDDVLLDPQYLLNKIRHEPFSVYLKFVEPSANAGTEAIYVEGKYDNKLVGHGTGLRAIFGTQHLDPAGTLAMMGNRHPITDSGMKNTLAKLKKSYSGPAFAHCQVEWVEEAEIDGRPCYGAIITNDEPRGEFRLAKVRLLFDRETKLLARFTNWQWLPTNPREPTLVEDYTYTKVSLEVDFDENDFDPANPEYAYP